MAADRMSVGEVWDWLCDEWIKYEGSAKARRADGQDAVAERWSDKARRSKSAADFILFMINHEGEIKAFMEAKRAAKARAIERRKGAA